MTNNTFYISAGLIPIDGAAVTTDNTFYISAGLLSDDITTRVKGLQIRPSFAGAGLSLSKNVLSVNTDNVFVYVYDDILTVSGAALYHNRHVVASGVSETTIAFPAGVDNTNYTIRTTLQNTTDASPSIYTYMITDTTTSGFTVKFSGDMDSANYVLNWYVVND